jgi:hypothetical protein
MISLDFLQISLVSLNIRFLRRVHQVGGCAVCYLCSKVNFPRLDFIWQLCFGPCRNNIDRMMEKVDLVFKLNGSVAKRLLLLLLPIEIILFESIIQRFADQAIVLNESSVVPVSPRKPRS